MPIMVTKNNYKIGMKVIRGRDWKWEDQDYWKGKPCIGIINSRTDNSFDNNIWVSVIWESERRNSYRIGSINNIEDPKFDLYMAKDNVQLDLNITYD
jgi:hypothetical protein